MSTTTVKAEHGREALDDIAIKLGISTPPIVTHQSPGKAIDPHAWPDPLDDAAFHGIAGELTNLLSPQSEADPAAILIQFLAATGNCIGRGPHYLVEGDRHGPQLYVALVGGTGHGRKGTSWGRIRQVLDMVADRWAHDRIVSGLSSAEGLLHAVRDATDDDPGSDDRRLLVVEPELASALRVMMRDGNTLSATVRQAWDRGDLRTLTKHSPITATGTHISIIGHITADELRRYMDRTEAANGYANRYLYVCTRRSKCLPDGGGEVDLGDIAQRLASVIDTARSIARVEMDDAARAVWHRVYPTLSAGVPGMLGAVTARAEAQVIRLALIYALLDGVNRINTGHLRAGLAIWTYAEASARYVWGSALGDPVADDLLRAIQGAGTAGMTRTEIRDLFKRHKSAEQITRALDLLARLGYAKSRNEDTGGRAAEIWTIA